MKTNEMMLVFAWVATTALLGLKLTSLGVPKRRHYSSNSTTILQYPVLRYYYNYTSYDFTPWKFH